MTRWRCFLTAWLALLAASRALAAENIPTPAPGKFYQGFYYDGSAALGEDSNEHRVTARDVESYEQTFHTQVAWVFFSDNWFESRAFPRATCDWIRRIGKVPYIRLMLRSDLDQQHAEKTFSLTNILAGKFDDDLRRWAREARAFGSPLLIEWGTEPNGDWFSWNGKWNGRGKTGPARFVAAYRHIVDLMRAVGASNLQWVWHVNWYDSPPAKWNRFENYYPGDGYCDWLGLSAYGPLTPMTRDGTESLRFKMAEAYPRLRKLAPAKPIVISEIGCDLHNRRVRADFWAKSALDDLFSGRWPGVIGFCWWNEAWENDDVKRHDTDMIIWHDPRLTSVFREELAAHGSQIETIAHRGK